MVAALVALGGGLWAVAHVVPPPATEGTPVAEPSENPEPDPLRVVVDPPRFPAGTEQVRVTAPCAETSAVAVSGAFDGAVSMDRRVAADLQGDFEVDAGLTPGAYDVIVKCGDQGPFGRAVIQVTKGASRPSGPPRVATTWITLSPAEPGSWLNHPEIRGERDVYLVAPILELKVTHQVQVPADDPDVAGLRAGGAGSSPATFTEHRMGVVVADGTDSSVSLAFDTPVVKVERGSRQAVITYRGTGYVSALSRSGGQRYVGVSYTPWQGEGVPPLTAHDVVVSATGWTLAGVWGPAPLEQDSHYLRLNAGLMRLAFTEDGHTADVSGYLTDDAYIGAYLDDSDPEANSEAGSETESFSREIPTFLDGLWTAFLFVAWVAAVVVLLRALVLALGRAWWRRFSNLLIVALLVAGPVMVVLVGSSQLLGIAGAALLLVGVPVVALLSAARAVPSAQPSSAPSAVLPAGSSERPSAGTPEEPPVVPSEAASVVPPGVALVRAGAVAAALAGVMLYGWALTWLVNSWQDLGWPVVVGALAVVFAVVLAVVPRLRPGLPVLGFLVFGSGVLLAGRGASIGFFPPTMMCIVLIAISVSAVAAGWATETNRRWSLRAVLQWVALVMVTTGMLAYPDFAVTWSSGEWFPQEEGLFSYMTLLFLFFSLPLLSLAMLLVRARRAGRTPEGLVEATPFHTAVLFVLLLRLPGIAHPGLLGVTVLLAWAGVSFLLPAARGHLVRPISETEHRQLVRDMLRRKSARLALTNLLRQPAGGDFEERRRALEQEGDERFGPVDSDLALATLAGRTPWQNALAALGVGAVLSVPFSTIRVVESVRGGQGSAGELLLAALTLLSLPALCMVFGYFYPRVRGTGPIAKSLTFLLAALLIELPVYVQTLVIAAASGTDLAGGAVPSPDQALVGVLVAGGNIAVVSIGLGLWWEWRLMALAGEPWARVRNIRTLRALAAPLAAASIAVGTTLATALVNNVVAPLPTAPVVENRPEPTQSP
ncbi:hypothetical protein [Nonomuraea sp. NPDC002799]